MLARIFGCVNRVLQKSADKEKAEDNVSMEQGEFLQFGQWKFRYDQEMIVPCAEYEFKLNGKYRKPNHFKYQLEIEYSENVSKYRNTKNQPVLVLYESVPTFDAEDREYDSYKELYVYSEEDHMVALLVRGGYRLSRVFYYTEIRGADADTMQLLQNMQL